MADNHSRIRLWSPPMTALTARTIVSELISRMKLVIDVNGMLNSSDALSGDPARPGMLPGRFL